MVNGHIILFLNVHFMKNVERIISISVGIYNKNYYISVSKGYE